MDTVLDKFPDAIITENPEYVKFSLGIHFFHYFCDLYTILSLKICYSKKLVFLPVAVCISHSSNPLPHPMLTS